MTSDAANPGQRLHLTTQLLPLVAGQMKVGSPLPFGVRDENGKLLLAAGQLIGTHGQLEALLARGLYADRAEIEAFVAGRGEAAMKTPLSLFDRWEQAVWQLDKLLRSVDQDPGFPERCDEFTNHLVALVQRDPDIAIYLAVRQDARRLKLYGLTHALHCALVCQLTVTRMGWPADRMRTLVKAALTMNLTIIDVQAAFAVQGRLTEAHRAQIAAHPQSVLELLRAAGVNDEAWLTTVIEHHERPGGGGYPAGSTDLSEEAAVLRMADVFMAKISPRTDRPALSIQVAARQMFNDAKGSPAAGALIKEFGIYPPGNFVQLACGELALVIRRGASANTPMAAAITDKSGAPTIHTTRRDTAQAAFAIKALAAESPLVLRMTPERLYGLAE
jgi:HD-GYP domain-containing protein (c-di-GMP phosphodiesterase class II)